jgi:hypothetical protein
VQGGLPAARAGEDRVAAYHRLARRRRLAVLTTAGTTVVLVVTSLALAAFMGDLVPPDVGRGGGMPAAQRTQDEFSPAQMLRTAALFLVVNPYPLVILALVVGVYSFRLWYRVFTGERAAVGFSIIDTLGGRPRS